MEGTDHIPMKRIGFDRGQQHVHDSGQLSHDEQELAKFGKRQQFRVLSSCQSSH